MNHCSFYPAGDLALNAALKLIDDNPSVPQPLQLMILDNQMPRMMGLEVISNLREQINGRNRTGRRQTQIREPKFVICSSFMTP